MIRLAEMNDLPELSAVYAAARTYMRREGNMMQWAGDYPPTELLCRDVAARQLYVHAFSGGIHGVFALIPGDDPTYASIEGGSWLSNTPYATIHRLAGDGKVPGIFRQTVAFCAQRYPHLRIDTHRDNLTMRRLIGRSGFTYCGVIHLADGAPRLAYERLPDETRSPSDA